MAGTSAGLRHSSINLFRLSKIVGGWFGLRAEQAGEMKAHPPRADQSFLFELNSQEWPPFVEVDTALTNYHGL